MHTTLNAKHYTLSTKHSTLNTLNTQHSRLNTQHSTPAPKHEIFNTQHSTLDPQPQTLAGGADGPEQAWQGQTAESKRQGAERRDREQIPESRRREQAPHRTIQPNHHFPRESTLEILNPERKQAVLTDLNQHGKDGGLGNLQNAPKLTVLYQEPEMSTFEYAV